MDRIITFLAGYASSLTYEKLPGEVVHEVKRRIIDALGCGIGSYLMEPPKIARALAMEVTASPGATVLGTRHRTTPELATFANGVMVRYLDFNDTSASGKSGHPSDNIPPVLAVAEYTGADVKKAITGIVIAYEVQDQFGRVCGIMDNGWDHATYMALSSTLGAGKALGLSEEQLANALALSATTSAALLQTRVGKLSMWKGCAAANASRNGVFAARLAQQGLTGPEEAFEGRRGFLKQLSRPIELPAFGGDGQPFRIQYDKYKLFPIDYEAQCAIHPALEIYKMLGGRVEEIEEVIVDTYDMAVEIAADSQEKWHPTTRETADHSIPYAVAVALTRGTVWLDDFTEECISDPQIHSLMQKIQVRRNAEYTRDWPEACQFRIEVVTHSGERHVRDVRYAKGHYKNPMTDNEIEAKFRRLAQPLLLPRQIDRILDQLWNLEQVQSLRETLMLFEV